MRESLVTSLRDSCRPIDSYNLLIVLTRLALVLHLSSDVRAVSIAVIFKVRRKHEPECAVYGECSADITPSASNAYVRALHNSIIPPSYRMRREVRQQSIRRGLYWFC